MISLSDVEPNVIVERECDTAMPDLMECRFARVYKDSRIYHIHWARKEPLSLSRDVPASSIEAASGTTSLL